MDSPKYVVKSLLLRNVFGILANYECDFGLEIRGVRSDEGFGDDGRGREGIGERRRRLHEEGGDIGHREIDLLSVVDILEAITDHQSNNIERHPEPS